MVDTTLYFASSGTPFCTPAAAGSWEQDIGSGVQTLPLKTSKSNTSLADVSGSFGPAVTGQTRVLEFISPPFAADGTILSSTTFDIVIRGSEGAASANLFLAFSARVISNDGSVTRGSLIFKGTNTGGTEFGTANQTRIWSAQVLTQVDYRAGDRLAIGVGWHGNAPAAGATGLLRIGDPSGTADFALTSGLTTDLVPWCRFNGQAFVFGDTLFPYGFGADASQALPDTTVAVVPYAEGDSQPAAAPIGVGVLSPAASGDTSLAGQAAASGALIPSSSGDTALAAAILGSGQLVPAAAGDGQAAGQALGVGVLSPSSTGESSAIATPQGLGAVLPYGAGEGSGVAQQALANQLFPYAGGESSAIEIPTGIGALVPHARGESSAIAQPIPATIRLVVPYSEGSSSAFAQPFVAQAANLFPYCEGSSSLVLFPRRSARLRTRFETRFARGLVFDRFPPITSPNP